VTERRLRVAILGGRGIPANYSGFDTLIEELSARLVSRHGMDVTVYCRRHCYDERPRDHRGVRCVYLRAVRGKGLESIWHTSRSVLHAIWRRFDVAFIVYPANAPRSRCDGLARRRCFTPMASVGCAASGVARRGATTDGSRAFARAPRRRS
jgi:Domain of unknown function (DUF1972)